MLDLLWITIILVHIIDLSGFIENISEIIWKWFYPKVKYNGWLLPKPISCSYCSTFWIGLIYLLVSGTFSFGMLVYLLTLAFLTPVIGKCLLFIKDLLDKILEILWKLID